MKIIQALGWYYPDSLGGTEVYVAALCERLQQYGHELRIAAPHAAREAEDEYVHCGVPVYRYPIPKYPTREETREFIPARGTERFHAWLARERPDVVHFHTFVTGLGLHEVKAAKNSGARVIVTTHASSLGYICQRGTMMRWGERLCDGLCEPAKCAACELQHRGLSKPVAATLGLIPPVAGSAFWFIPGKVGTALAMSYLISHNREKQTELFQCIDKFVVLTQWAFDTVLMNNGPHAIEEKLVLNRLGVAHSQHKPKPGPDIQPTRKPLKIGYMGRFESVKGVVHLARAVSAVDKSLNFHLEFRGPAETDSEQAVMAEIKRLVSHDSRVTFAPAVASSDVPEILCRYDVLCCPSVCLEGGPTIAMEAHSVGTPVIGSAIGGLSELVTDRINGRLLPPGDINALADAITVVARDPAGTIDQWRKKLPLVRTMDDVAREYLNLYRS